MPMAVALTPVPSAGGIRIEVSGAPTTGITITRTDQNGGGLVRLLEGQVPASGGTLTITDFEHALTGTVRYLVTSILAVNGSDPVANSVVVTGLYPDTWLSVPVLPAVNTKVRKVLDYTHKRMSRSIVHQVIARNTDVVNLQRPGLRTGTFKLFAATYEEAFLIDYLLARPEVLMLRQPEIKRLDTYFALDSISVDPASEDTDNKRWIVSCGYHEVYPPVSPQLGTKGWDVQAVANTYASVAAAAGSYDTVAGLAAGPVG